MTDSDETTLQVFERLRLQNELLKDELIDLQRRHVELQREHIELLEKHVHKHERVKLSDAERERIVELARTGMPPREIAAVVGRKANTVRQTIHVARHAGQLPWPAEK